MSEAKQLSRPRAESRPDKPRAGTRAFTLVEMLVVLAIIAVLATIAAPSVLYLFRGPQLTQTAQQAADEFAFARQLAVTKNRTVEVRFYQMAISGMPGETMTNASTGKFCAMQSFIYDTSGNATQADMIRLLPASIIIDSNTNISPLLGPSLAKTNWSTADPQISLPKYGGYYNAYAFDFKSDGSATLAVGTQWYVTLHSRADGNNLSTPPASFATLQLNPQSGRIQVFRP